jgi:hypothetical protein
MANTPLSSVRKTINKTSITISYMALYFNGDSAEMPSSKRETLGLITAME